MKLRENKKKGKVQGIFSGREFWLKNPSLAEKFARL